MIQAEVKSFEEYYQSFSVDKLVELMLKNESGYRPETIQAIKNLLVQKSGSVESAMKTYYQNYEPIQLFELLTKQNKDYVPEVLAGIKFLLEQKKGGIEAYLKEESAKSGRVSLVLTDVRYEPFLQEVPRKVTGDFHITTSHIFFVAKKILTKHITKALIGGLIPELLDELFNKKQVANYDLPLTLQAKYTEDSVGVELDKIKEVRLGKKSGAIYIAMTDNKTAYHFFTNRENKEKVKATLESYSIRTIYLKGFLGWVEDFISRG